MNIHDIKKKVNETYYDGPVQDEMLFLLSIIEQAEKDLKNIEQWFISMCMEGRAESVRDILKSIQGDE